MADRELWVQMEFQVRIDEDRLRASATYPVLDGAGQPLGVTTADEDMHVLQLIGDMLTTDRYAAAVTLRREGIEIGQSSGCVIEPPHQAG